MLIMIMIMIVLIILFMVFIPVSVNKHSSGEEDPRENQLAKHQIRGWRAVSAAGLQGKGCHKRSVYFTGTGVISFIIIVIIIMFKL